jgi:hypothetical protein
MNWDERHRPSWPGGVAVPQEKIAKQPLSAQMGWLFKLEQNI